MWELTQPITWSPTNTSQARIAGVRVNNTATGGIEIATSNPTVSGQIYASQHASNNWESIPVGNQRVFTILDEAGNTYVPGNLTVNGLIRGNIYEFIFPLGCFKMLYYHPGGMFPVDRIDDVTFINQMKAIFNQTWVTVAKNTSWGTLRMDIVQRTG